jgi:hypothetical protein
MIAISPKALSDDNQEASLLRNIMLAVFQDKLSGWNKKDFVACYGQRGWQAVDKYARRTIWTMDGPIDPS